MRFVHLSDLHLGKRVYEFSLLEDQEFILKRIITIIKDLNPDGVIIAGDVYDKSIPSEDAMRLWDEFLISLAKNHIPIFAINGNHDSAIRLSDHGKLIEAAGIHISPVYDGNVKKCTMEDENGRVNIFLLPFVKPAIVRSIFPEEEIKDYSDACRVAVQHMDINKEERNILVAHQFITGAERCESEDIVVGGLDNVDGSVFDDFDYVALGHLHGKQSIGRDTVRYCGTPLKYSFSEKNHKKSLTIVDMKEKGTVEISEVPLIPKHDMREIKGTFEKLTQKESYEGTSTEDYIHVVLTDENEVPDAVGKLRIIYPNLMKLSYDNKRTSSNQEISEVQEEDVKNPLVVFGRLYEMQNNQEMTEEQKNFVQECIKSIWGETN